MSKQSEALSPWGMKPAHAVEVYPLEQPFRAEIALPGSKSFTNRALVLAAIARGKSILHAPLFSDDSYWCADTLRKLGVGVEADKDSGTIAIDGTGMMEPRANEALYIGSAGTIARFLPGVLAARGRGDIVLTASSQLSRRPVGEMINALRNLGARIDMPEGASFPMRIAGGSLEGGETSVSGKISSQFISGLLIAAPLARKPVTIRISDHIVQSDYVRITLQIMNQFGVQVDYDDSLTKFHIEPQEYATRDIVLEADASTATYFAALAAATQSEITITNLNPGTLQPDFGFIRHLESMGCSVHIDGTRVQIVGPTRLTSGRTYNLNDCSDSTPALVSIAPFASGMTKVEGVEHIRSHESDRIAVMRATLEKSGVPVTEFADGLEISPADGVPRHVVVDPHDDHRMAMSFAVMGAAGRGATILDPSCVSKTCPDFFDLIGALGVRCDIIPQKTGG